MIIIISVILIFVAIVVFMWIRKRSKKFDITFEDETGAKYFVSTSGQSTKRVLDLGLDRKTFDASHLLDTTKLQLQNYDSTRTNYEPNAAVDWIIDVDVFDATVRKDLLWKAFQVEDWRKEYPATELYGFSSEENRWTFVIAGGVPEQFNKLQFGCRFLEMFDEASSVTSNRFSDYLLAIDNRFKKYNIPAALSPRIPPSEAAERAQEVIRIAEELNRDVLVMLKSEERPFNLRKCWQVLTNLGLQWGDGDLFHWNNEVSRGVFFSVWTTTSPGYFFPEDVAVNKYAVEDLVFGFSIPRNQDPEGVLLVMLDCINYCNRELGGYVLNRYGERTNITDLKDYVRQAVRELNARDFPPGSEAALRIFR